MLKDEIASFSLVKIIFMSFIMICCSTIGVMAFNMQINDAIKMVPVKYENEVTEEDVESNEASLENILNSYQTVVERMETITEEIPFETITKEVSGGNGKVIQEGQNGEKQITYKVKYANEQEIGREEISVEVTKPPVDKIVEKQKVTSRSAEAPRSSDGYIKFSATGYCPCVKCCGKTTGITASGAKAQAGTTIATSSSYKFGTTMEIKGMGTYTVQDRGGAIQGNKIDIYFDTHQEALNFGRRTVEVYVNK